MYGLRATTATTTTPTPTTQSTHSAVRSAQRNCARLDLSFAATTRYDSNGCDIRAHYTRTHTHAITHAHTHTFKHSLSHISCRACVFPFDFHH